MIQGTGQSVTISYHPDHIQWDGKEKSSQLLFACSYLFFQHCVSLTYFKH